MNRHAIQSASVAHVPTLLTETLADLYDDVDESEGEDEQDKQEIQVNYRGAEEGEVEVEEAVKRCAGLGAFGCGAT